MDVGDGALGEVDVEAKEVHIIHGFQLNWVAKEVRVDECLNADVGEESVVEGDEGDVDVAVVGEVDLGVVCEGVVELMPGVLGERDGDIAQRWRELGANPSSSYLLKVGSTCLQNTGVECNFDDGDDVGGVNGALGRVTSVVLADEGKLKWVSCGMEVNSECGGIEGQLPLGGEALDRIQEPILWDGVEKANEVIVDCMEVSISRKRPPKEVS